MKIIISPAKKMTRPEFLEPRDIPVFNDRAIKLATCLSQVSENEMKSIMKASDKIVDDTIGLYRSFMGNNETYPAILSYDGIQYRYMGCDIFTMDEYEYLQKHLRILSALYGVLRPFDGIKPYRLEMQARIADRDMYSFWNDDIYRNITEDDNVILNLASEEYGKCVRKYLDDDIRLVDVCFSQRKGGKLREQATYAKMMRGRAVRYAAEHRITTPGELKPLTEFGYVYNEELSSENMMMFIRDM